MSKNSTGRVWYQWDYPVKDSSRISLPSEYKYGLWCYLANTDNSWELCDVPYCKGGKEQNRLQCFLVRSRVAVSQLHASFAHLASRLFQRVNPCTKGRSDNSIQSYLHLNHVMSCQVGVFCGIRPNIVLMKLEKTEYFLEFSSLVNLLVLLAAKTAASDTFVSKLQV